MSDDPVIWMIQIPLKGMGIKEKSHESCENPLGGIQKGRPRSGGGGGQPKRDKRGQGEGGGPSKRDVLFTNTDSDFLFFKKDSDQKETNALDIMPVFNKNDHLKSPLKKPFKLAKIVQSHPNR